MFEHTDREKNIIVAMKNNCCPFDGTKLKLMNYHERDSTYDRFVCTKCDWYYMECESWDLND